MKEVESRHPPGAVALIAADQPRFHHLQASLIALKVPQGSVYYYASSCNPCKNSNLVTQMMLDNPKLKWLWLMGDDHCFEDDALLRLLDRDVPVIVPLTPRRMYPHDTVLWKEINPEQNTSKLFTWAEISKQNDIFKVAAAGSAGMLVRRHVFESFGKPYFRVGFTGPDELSEDVEFTVRCNGKGFTVWCDPFVTMGHLTIANMYPYRKDGKIGVAANMNGHRVSVVAPQ